MVCGGVKGTRRWGMTLGKGQRREVLGTIKEQKKRPCGWSTAGKMGMTGEENERRQESSLTTGSWLRILCMKVTLHQVRSEQAYTS